MSVSLLTTTSGSCGDFLENIFNGFFQKKLFFVFFDLKVFYFRQIFIILENFNRKKFLKLKIFNFYIKRLFFNQIYNYFDWFMAFAIDLLLSRLTVVRRLIRIDNKTLILLNFYLNYDYWFLSAEDASNLIDFIAKMSIR